MNTEEIVDMAVKDQSVKNATSLIVALRQYGIDEEKIYETLKKDYSENFTDKELKQLMKETK